MKIALVNTMVPFLYGGAEILVLSLKDKLIEYGHEAEIFKIPFSWHPLDNIIDSIMAARFTKLTNMDLMIGFKFPTYLISHPNKKLWIMHQLRQAYDQSGTKYGLFSETEYDQSIKSAVIQADNCYLKPMEGKIFTISPVVSSRLKKYNSIDSTPLMPPLANEQNYYCGEYGDYIYYPSRVNAIKRQHLLIEAMCYTKSKIKLVLSGPGDTCDDERFVFKMIEKYDLSGKVVYLNKFITEQEKNDLYANSLGVAFIPVDEDYGYITAEAFQSSKAVITCTDSGTPPLLVQEGISGFVAEPNAKSLSIAIDQLANNRKKAAEMGENAKLRLKELNINWDNVIRSLIK